MTIGINCFSQIAQKHKVFFSPKSPLIGICDYMYKIRLTKIKKVLMANIEKMPLMLWY